MSYSPERDGSTAAGIRWPSPAPRRIPGAKITRHRHVTADGVELVCVSQLFVSRGLVRDWYELHGWHIATGTRDAVDEQAHTVPPDWRWAETAALGAVDADVFAPV